MVPAQEAPLPQVLWEMLPLGCERSLLQANLPPQPPLSPLVSDLCSSGTTSLTSFPHG